MRQLSSLCVIWLDGILIGHENLVHCKGFNEEPRTHMAHTLKEECMPTPITLLDIGVQFR